jgi:hypothetical protein
MYTNIHKISIAGWETRGEGSKYKDRYIGVYEIEDLTAQRKKLEQIIADYTPLEPRCSYNSSRGTVNCLSNCFSNYVDEKCPCPEQTFHEAQRNLSRINLRQFLTMEFSEPGLAKYNGVLDGENVINSHL